MFALILLTGFKFSKIDDNYNINLIYIKDYIYNLTSENNIPFQWQSQERKHHSLYRKC